MNIDKILSQLEDELDNFENANEPDDRLEIKQTITHQIKAIRQFAVSQNKPLTMQQNQTVSDIEEILSY